MEIKNRMMMMIMMMIVMTMIKMKMMMTIIIIIIMIAIVIIIAATMFTRMGTMVMTIITPTTMTTAPRNEDYNNDCRKLRLVAIAAIVAGERIQVKIN